MHGGFEKYLISKAFIKEKYVPFYLKWVLQCYSYFGLPATKLLSSDQLQNYLKHISKSREDWQVQQAAAGQALYCCIYESFFSRICFLLLISPSSFEQRMILSAARLRLLTSLFIRLPKSVSDSPLSVTAMQERQ